MISNTRSKRANENIATSCTHANFHVFFSFGFHYNALFVLITIRNTRSKRVNENIARQCTRQENDNYVYMQIFMFVGFVVIEIRLFNRKKKKKKKQKKMKNTATL